MTAAHVAEGAGRREPNIRMTRRSSGKKADVNQVRRGIFSALFSPPFTRQFLARFFRSPGPLNSSKNQYISPDQFVLYGTRFSCQIKLAVFSAFRP
jgi:hypothetical protein